MSYSIIRLQAIMFTSKKKINSLPVYQIKGALCFKPYHIKHCNERIACDNGNSKWQRKQSIIYAKQIA